MKTMIKKLVMPIAVLFIAITVALAGNVTANVDQQSIEPGFRKVGASCIQTATMCSTVNTGFICTDGVNQLYQLDVTSCNSLLFEPVN